MAGMIIGHVTIFALFVGVSLVSSYFILRLLNNANFKEENFLKQQVITSSGVVFLVFLVFYAIYLLTYGQLINLKGWPYSLLIIALGMGVLGFLDDLFGDHRFSGFAGHFGALAQGQVTTGLLKAILGFGLSLLVAILASASFVDIIVNALIIALSINFFNLLDLRPGRTIKAFILSAVVIFLLSRVEGLWLVSLPVLAPVVILLWLDLKLLSMLGDTGSNFLGAMIGIWVVYSFDLKINLALLLGLIIIHLYSEKHSISAFISKNKVLSWFDNLGLSKKPQLDSERE